MPHAAAVISRTGLLVVLAVMIVPLDARAAETVTIQPAGTITVGEMPSLDARTEVAVEPRTIPFMPMPPGREIPLPPGVAPPASAPLAPLVEPESGGPLGPTVTTNFQALADNNTAIPPDTQGAVGPSHVMTMVNSQVHIQDKTGGNVSLVSLTSFWTSGTGLSGDPFDPHVTYDSISGRWIAACDANGQMASSEVFFAISATDNPTGAWTFYSFVADGTGSTWADYPGLGVNSTWIAISENMFTVGPDAFAGAKMWVIDKSTALAGGALTVTIFTPGFESAPCGAPPCGSTLVPAVTFSAAEPTLYLVDNSGFTSGGTHLIRLSRLTGTGPAPVWSAVPGGPFTPNGFFLVANNYDFGMIGAPQLGVTATCNGGSNDGLGCTSDGDCPPGLPTAACRLINTNDPRIINVVHRNGRLWFAHGGGLPVGAVDRTAAFWYQVDPATLSVTQSGVINGGAGVHHFFPSIAANTADDAVLGFSRSDAGRFAEAVYTSRNATDGPGAMDPITVLKAGEDSYLKDFGTQEIRWGDYSATVIDPSDDTTFWTIQEYAATDVGPNTSNDRWGLWWGKLIVGPTPTPTVSPTPTPRLTCTPPPAPAPTATPVTAGALKCRRGIAKEAGKFLAAKTKILQKCEANVVKNGFGSCPDATATTKIATATSKLSSGIGKACGGDDKVCGSDLTNEEPPAGLGWPATCPNFEGNANPDCSAAIADCSDIAACIGCVGEAAVDQAIDLYYASLNLPSAGDLNKCQQTIGKATAKFVLAKAKSIQKCWDARLKGKHGDTCPNALAAVGSPAQKAALAIGKAEAKKVKAICSACGGADKLCDATIVAPDGAVFTGSGSGDDLTPAVIGFPATCPDVKVPGGGPFCVQAVATLADLVECVDCVSEFKVDCVDRVGVPELAQYPCECNP